MYSVASSDPDPNPRGGGQLPNPNPNRNDMAPGWSVRIPYGWYHLRIRHALRRYTGLNFRTNIVAEQFQQAIQQTLSDIPGVMSISDDIIGFGADETAHNHALQQCFARLEVNSLTINRKKCKFYKDKLDFYGLTFLAEGISPDDKKVEAFKNAPPLTNSSEVRSLLGMSSWFSKWIPDYATIMAPLRALTVKHVKCMWKAEHREAWLKLKDALTSAAVLAYFDHNIIESEKLFLMLHWLDFLQF